MKERILVAVALFTHAKDYVLPLFVEMMKACVLADDVDVIVIGDQRPLGIEETHFYMESPGPYSEDMLIPARGMALQLARDGHYKKLVFQGVDALWQSRPDFRELVRTELPIVAPLIAGRTDEDILVARSFDRGPNGEVLETQTDYIPKPEPRYQRIDGFPGVDNCVIDRDCFDVEWPFDHKPWYRRVADGEVNLCVEEEWLRRCVERGIPIYLDTAVNVWHVHEVDLLARMWPGVAVPMGRLAWEPVECK